MFRVVVTSTGHFAYGAMSDTQESAVQSFATAMYVAYDAIGADKQHVISFDTDHATHAEISCECISDGTLYTMHIEIVQH